MCSLLQLIRSLYKLTTKYKNDKIGERKSHANRNRRSRREIEMKKAENRSAVEESSFRYGIFICLLQV